MAITEWFDQLSHKNIPFDKHIFFEHFLGPMRLIYVVFVLLLALMMSAQCQQTAADWVNKGNNFFNMGFYDLAIKCYDEAILIDSNDTYAWCAKGKALMIQDEYDEAVKAFDEAIRLDPQYTETWNSKGYALFNHGKYDEAIKAFNDALKIDKKLT